MILSVSIIIFNLHLLLTSKDFFFFNFGKAFIELNLSQ